MRLDLCSNGGTCFGLPGRSNHQSCQSIPPPLLCSRSLGHRSLQFGPARQRNLSSRKTTPHAGGGEARGVGPTDARTDQSSRGLFSNEAATKRSSPRPRPASSQTSVLCHGAGAIQLPRSRALPDEYYGRFLRGQTLAIFFCFFFKNPSDINRTIPIQWSRRRRGGRYQIPSTPRSVFACHHDSPESRRAVRAGRWLPSSEEETSVSSCVAAPTPEHRISAVSMAHGGSPERRYRCRKRARRTSNVDA